MRIGILLRILVFFLCLIFACLNNKVFAEDTETVTTSVVVETGEHDQSTIAFANTVEGAINLRTSDSKLVFGTEGYLKNINVVEIAGYVSGIKFDAKDAPGFFAGKALTLKNYLSYYPLDGKYEGNINYLISVKRMVGEEGGSAVINLENTAGHENNPFKMVLFSGTGGKSDVYKFLSSATEAAAIEAEKPGEKYAVVIGVPRIDALGNEKKIYHTLIFNQKLIQTNRK